MQFSPCCQGAVKKGELLTSAAKWLRATSLSRQRPTNSWQRHRSRAGALLVLGFQGIARGHSTRARSGGDRAPVLIRRRESMCEFDEAPPPKRPNNPPWAR